MIREPLRKKKRSFVSCQDTGCKSKGPGDVDFELNSKESNQSLAWSRDLIMFAAGLESSAPSTITSRKWNILFAAVLKSSAPSAIATKFAS